MNSKAKRRNGKRKTKKAERRKPETGQVRILSVLTSNLIPSPENDRLYRPADPADPEMKKLAKSIQQNGVMEPLVVTLDNFILSGHRRHCAAKIAREERVPVQYVNFHSCDDPDRFMVLLREFNRQRDKSATEKLREELVTVNPHEAYQTLIDYREKSSAVAVKAMALDPKKRRADISAAKAPLLKAITKIVWDMREYWPLSVRGIHYHLLNDPPLRHASKPKSRYKNNRDYYSDMDDVLVRARLDGIIPMEAISDETRPVTTWDCHRDVRSFISKELGGMFKGYWRDLQQSQPNHIEILCEKNTVHPILRSVAMKYCIPITSGRGFCSLPPRHAMADRFAASGGEKLILLIVSDFDPAGESIAESYARSMRDDFYIDSIHPIKVALTKQQAIDRGVSLEMPPKKRSPKYKPFVKQHGHGTAELEALAPGDLQDILTEAIDSVMNIDAFNEELEREEEDARFLEGVRRQVKGALEGIDFENWEN